MCMHLLTHMNATGRHSDIFAWVEPYCLTAYAFLLEPDHIMHIWRNCKKPMRGPRKLSYQNDQYMTIFCASADWSWVNQPFLVTGRTGRTNTTFTLLSNIYYAKYLPVGFLSGIFSPDRDDF